MTAIAIDNLAAFGVEEIDTDTAERVEGGVGLWGGIVAGLIGQVIYSFLEDPDGAAKAFMNGFNATAS
jgi:prolipoprotein diacylglyceryltransferase